MPVGTISRVYADVNSASNQVDWDYDNLQVNWG